MKFNDRNRPLRRRRIHARTADVSADGPLMRSPGRYIGDAPINCAPTVFPGMSECTTQIKMCPEESIYLFISKEKFYGQPYFLRTGIQVKRNGEVALCVFVLPDTTGGSACSLWRIILNDHWHTNGPAIHRRMAAGELRLFEHS